MFLFCLSIVIVPFFNCSSFRHGWTIDFDGVNSHNVQPRKAGKHPDMGVQWLSGIVLYWRPWGRGFMTHRRHCVLSFSKNINCSLVLVQPRKTRPFITERL